MPVTAVLHSPPGSRKVTLESHAPPIGSDAENNGKAPSPPKRRGSLRDSVESLQSIGSSDAGNHGSAEKAPTIPKRRGSLRNSEERLTSPDAENNGSAEGSPMLAKRRGSLVSSEQRSPTGELDGEKSGSAEGSSKLLARRRSSVSKATFSTSSQDGWAAAENSRLYREVRASDHPLASPTVASHAEEPALN